MRAVVADDYGPPESLAVRDVPVPRPGPGQVQVRVRAAALNPGELRLLAGGLGEAAALSFPHVVGGDFAKDTIQEKNCFLTTDGGKTWTRPTTPPHGYRSCVEFIGGNAVLSCGTSGVDLSDDDGMNWRLVSTAGFHACRVAKKGKAVFLAGSNGRVAKLVR